jgi:hypothetical protein
MNTKSRHYSAIVRALCARLHELTNLWKLYYKGTITADEQDYKIYCFLKEESLIIVHFIEVNSSI